MLRKDLHFFECQIKLPVYMCKHFQAMWSQVGTLV